MSENKTQLELSPISSWIDGELVKLPSGRVYRLRQLDMLSMVDEGGNVPNFLLAQIAGKKSGAAEPNPADILQMGPLLNKIALQSVVEPAIVETVEEMQAGKGIRLINIPMMDKMGMLNYSMGGQASVDSAMRFLSKQAQPVAVVPEQKQHITE
jgi:hypothetical protein